MTLLNKLFDLNKELYSPHTLFGVIASGKVTGPTPDFEDDYTTNTGWTQVGTNITVNSVGNPDVCYFNADDANNDEKDNKQLGFTLSDSLWYADWEMKTISGSVDWFSNPYMLTSSTGKTQSADAIGIRIQGGTGSAANCFAIRYDGGVGAASAAKIDLTTTTLYYFRLERTSTTNIKLSVFTDSGRTTHETGSPVSLTIPSTVQTLTTLQHSNLEDAFNELITLQIDNTEIFDGVAP